MNFNKLFKLAVKFANNNDKYNGLKNELHSILSGRYDANELKTEIVDNYGTEDDPGDQDWTNAYFKDPLAKKFFEMDQDELAAKLIEAGKDTSRQNCIKRVHNERAILEYGNSVDWNRERVINYCLQGVSGWLGREVFEESFDDGSMKECAEIYDKIGKEFGI